MDTEEDMPRPNELQDGTMAEVNALRDLLSQIGDPDAAHDAGVSTMTSTLSGRRESSPTPRPSPPTERVRPRTWTSCLSRCARRSPSPAKPRPTRQTSTT